MRPRTFSLILGAGLLALTAPGQEVPAPRQAIRYPIDANHTTIGFLAPVLGAGKVSGKFPTFEGSIVLHDPEDLTTMDVELVIDAASISTGIADRDQHLRTADFFDTGSHPEITFKSKRVDRDVASGDAYRLVGELTLRGVTKEIAIPFRVTAHSEFLGADSRFTLDRTEYGVSWMRVMDDGSLFVGKEIEIELFVITRLGRPFTPGRDPMIDKANEPDGKKGTSSAEEEPGG
ncbi:MAG TPA: YceI family protein [Thermoanaerobaculia bacterium]|jgi:polyisoprenoid-binding protein YceI